MTEEQKKEQKQIKEKEQEKKEKDQRILDCEKKRDEYLAGWRRARADFLNYKKDETEKLGVTIFFAQRGLILKILPILDNFYKAEQDSVKLLEKHQSPELKQSIKGFLQIKKQIEGFLKDLSVEQIKTVGEKFDPNFHEAIEEVEVKNKETGVIVEEVEKGYTFQNKVIRPSKVKTAK